MSAWAPRGAREQWLRPRHAVAADLIRAGATAGKFREDIDVEVTLDLLFAPVYYRLLLGHDTLSAEFARESVRQVLSGIGRS